MAIKFTKTAGEAKKDNLPFLKYENGANRFRMVGDVLARYVYWLKTNDDKPVSLECLAFDRETESFARKEKDWVKEFFPDEKCSWSYVIQCLTPSGELKVLPLKKKMFSQIIDASKKLESDPTDQDTGFWVTVDRKKTGPLSYNVEYTLDILACQKDIGALSDEEKAVVEEGLKPIDTLFPRQSPEDQKKFITDRILATETSKEEDSESAEILNSDFDDDVQF